MTETDAPAVRRQIVVNAPIISAFKTFTERFGDFKPPEHNLLSSPIAETVFEPRVGGNIVDRAADGSECRWARILAYEPPDRVVFSWDISPTMAGRPRPRSRQRGRSPIHRRVVGPHATRVGASEPRASRSGLAVGPRRR